MYRNVTQMRNLCQIFRVKRKICAVVLILCLISGFTPAAEGISAKLRGKIVLAGILSGVAYATHVLIKRDRQTVAELRQNFGSPERVVHFERGFDLWRVEYYGERHYIFRNNRLLREKFHKPLLSVYDVPRGRSWQTGSLEAWSEGWQFRKKKCASNLPIFQSSNFLPFLIDMPVSGNPRWSQLYLLDSLRAPKFVVSDLHRLAAERSLDPRLWLSH